MKKFISLVILFLLTINVKANVINNNNISISDEEYNNLLSIGFTDKEIENLSNEEYLEYKDVVGTNLTVNTKYLKVEHVTKNGITNSTTYEIDEDEYNNPNMIDPIRGEGTVYTEYKKLTTSVSKTNDNYVTAKVTLEWRKMPKKRSYDIIGVGYYTTNQIRNYTPSFKMTYTTSSDNMNHISYNHTWKQTGNDGDSAVYQLPSSTIKFLSAYILVKLERRYANIPVTYIEVYGDYAHATSTISETNALKHSMYYTGLSLQNSIVNYYDTTPSVGANWSGTL